MKIRVFILSGVLAACAADTGTGDDDDDGGTPLPPNHIRGAVELDMRVPSPGTTLVPSSELRMAVVWWGDRLTSTRRPLVAQNVPIVSVSPTWPATFELAITEPPPDGASHMTSSSFGVFVAYRDTNNNGELDWTPVDATAFVDRVVAFHPFLGLWFTDFDQTLALQFGDVTMPPSTPITLLERSEPRASCHVLEVRTRSSYAAKFQEYIPDPNMGDQGPWDGEDFQACPDHDPPDGASIACDDTGPGQYQYYAAWQPPNTSSFVTDICGPLVYTCEGLRSDPQAPGPWPCPCDPQRHRCVRFMSDL